MVRRAFRRVVGLLNARLPELKLEEVPDPRARHVRWSLAQILSATLLGLMAGCRNLGEVEALTSRLSLTMRRLLRLPRRLPDTTMRDTLCRVSLEELRAVLHRLVVAAWRRKALQCVGLPFHAVALDGKATSLPCWDDEFVQRHIPDKGLPYGLARTVTCSLVSAPGRPCIDAIPIPAKTNEMGVFQSCFESTCAKYGSLFRVVTYDAGALSEANARTVVAAGKDYLFALKGELRTMFKLADELLASEAPVAATLDRLDTRRTVQRSVSLLNADPSYSYGNGKRPGDSTWLHAKTFLRVTSELSVDGVLESREERMYVSSLATDALTPEQWLLLVRSHWGVENNNHNTYDTAFAEDERPWITGDTHGMLAVLLLRRIAYSLLALFRSVTLRSEAGRATPWKSLMSLVRDVMVGATSDEVAGLRPRQGALAMS